MMAESFTIKLDSWSEIAPSISVVQESIQANGRQPSYGRYLEDFVPGDIFIHPRGITLHAAFAQEFATTFMEACPLFLTETYPKALGFKGQIVSPLMVLAATLSLGVQNESEKAIAHLGYYDVCFPEITYAGDTLRAITKVLARKDRGQDEPGIVHVQTVGLNQRGGVAVRYERKIMIPRRPAGAGIEKVTRDNSQKSATRVFTWQDAPVLYLPSSATSVIDGWTAGSTFFDDFREGEILLHANGRTITDEHLAWTYRLGNTHPLHFDAVYTNALPKPMGGAPVVYGGLVFSWLAGLASRDVTENMIWDLGYTEGYHTQPVRSGDTLLAISRVLSKEDVTFSSGCGILTIQLIGLKNVSSKDAFNRYGHELFIKENDKKKLGLNKIAAKIFEIERRLLIRRC